MFASLQRLGLLCPRSSRRTALDLQPKGFLAQTASARIPSHISVFGSTLLPRVGSCDSENTGQLVERRLPLPNTQISQTASAIMSGACNHSDDVRFGQSWIFPAAEQALLGQPQSCRTMLQLTICCSMSMAKSTMRFGSTAKVLAKCKLKYYRISECKRWSGIETHHEGERWPGRLQAGRQKLFPCGTPDQNAIHPSFSECCRQQVCCCGLSSQHHRSC